MPLLTCPDCGGSVSDRATACPRCGRPNEAAPPPAWPPPPPPSGPLFPERVPASMRPEWERPKHTFAGKAYVVLGYVSAALLLLIGILFLVAPAAMFGPDIGADMAIGFAVACVLIAALTAAVSRGVAHFATWAWWVTMAVLVLGTLGALASILDPAETSGSRASSVLTLVLDAIWLHYFWTRRADF